MHPFAQPLLGLSVVLAATIPSTSIARTEAKSFRADYAVTYLGLTVARSTMTSTLDNNAYSIDGSVATAGLGAIFDDTKATLSVRGRLSAKGATPTRASTNYKHNKKSKSLTISFAGGSVTGTKMVPPPKPRSEDWVPVTQAQLRSVLDPLSALLISAPKLEQVCSKSLKFYDGEMRFDLKLRHEETKTVTLSGYEGPAVTCSASFNPVSGYKANKKSIKFMRDRSRITITFAPLGTTGVYAPVQASVGTEIGTLYLQARKVQIIE